MPGLIVFTGLSARIRDRARRIGRRRLPTLRLVALAALALGLVAVGAHATAVEAPEPSEAAVRYHQSGHWHWLARRAWSVLVPGLIVFTGLSARIRDRARRIGRRRLPTLPVYVVLYAALTFVVDLPLDWLQGFVRPHEYGLSNQSLGRWLGHAATSGLVGLAGGLLFLWIPYRLLAASPRRWWLYTTIAIVPVLMLVVLVAPVWIDPLYNRYGPMQDAVLEQKILALADRAGIEGGRVYEVNKSADTGAVNAYVTGLLGSKRIVLWDTLLTKLDHDGVLFVVGHEMGHYVLHHVLLGLLLAPLGVLVTLWLVDRAGVRLVRRFAGRFGFTELSDVASLPLLIMLVRIVLIAVMPFVHAVSRYAEREADRFGLEITRDNRAAASAFVALQAENLGHPRPGIVYRLLRSTHPPLGERIDFCNGYRPWEQGRPGRYEDRFRASEPVPGAE